MRNLWIKIGCFLTGYNYGILRTSSELSKKTLKRYTAALLIICILWSFIGFTFTSRYLHGNTLVSTIGAIVFVCVVIQIERQIILSYTKNNLLYISRGIIAFLMAIIGAVIIDQIIFKDDIDLAKTDVVNKRVEEAMVAETKELKIQIAGLDTSIYQKELERINLIADIERNPTVKSINTQTSPTVLQKTTTNDEGQKVTTQHVKKFTSVSVNSLPNPKISMIKPLEENIEELRTEKIGKESELLNMRKTLKDKVEAKVGFLDELNIMIDLLLNSKAGAIIWFLWFLFVLGLEMLVLISKLKEEDDDYKKTIRHHMQMRMKQLELLSGTGENNRKQQHAHAN